MEKYFLKNRGFLISLLIFVIFLCLMFYFISYLEFFEIAKSQRTQYGIVQILYFLISIAVVLPIYAVVCLRKDAKNIIFSMLIVAIAYVVLSTIGAVLIHSHLLYSSHPKSVSLVFVIIYAISGFGLFTALLKVLKIDNRDNIGSLTLRGRLKQDILILSETTELFFIQSIENYCEIIYREDETLKKKVFRASVRELDKQLISKQYMRVHKSYILNLRLIQEVVGNANNSIAHLKTHDLKVPIARSKRDEVLNRLKLR